MPRNGSGVYSAPVGTTAVPNTPIESAPYNALVADLVQDANAARPITAGGTGAATAADARTNLGINLMSGVTAVGTLAGTDRVYVDQGTGPEYATAQQIANFAVASGVFLQSGTGAVSRNPQDKMREIVSIADFGASPAATAAANTTAIVAALTAASAVYVPPGVYECNEITAPAKDLVIYGAGSNVSILRFVAGPNGIVWNNTTSARPNIIISGLALQAGVTLSGSPLSLSTGELGEVHPDVIIEDVWAIRLGSAYWQKGFLFNNCRNSVIEKSGFTGDAFTNNSEYAFKFDGLCLDTRLTNVFIAGAGVGVDSDGVSEGLVVHGLLAIDINVGVQKTHASGAEPMVNITGSHINALTKCVELSNCQQSQIVGNLFYAYTDRPTDPGWIGVHITGSLSRHNVLAANTFHGLGYSGTRTMVEVDTGLNHLVCSNTMVGADVGVSVSGSATNTQVFGNQLNSVTTPYAIAGADNILESTLLRTREFSAHDAPTMRFVDRTGPLNSKNFELEFNDGTMLARSLTDALGVSQVFARFAPGALSLGGTLNAEALRVITGSFANRVEVQGAGSGSTPIIRAEGSDANINLNLRPKGTGLVSFGTRVASSDVPVTGYIEIFDAAGTVRRLAVVG